MIAYKCTRANGKDFKTNTVLYSVGNVVEQSECDPTWAGSCGRGLHVSPTPHKTCRFGDRSIDRGRWRWFEVDVDEANIIARDNEKLRVKKLKVVREISKDEMFGDLRERSKKVREVAATFKSIPWLAPKERVDDAILLILFKRWRENLLPWAGNRKLPERVRIVRTASADADAAAGAAAAAAADVAAGASADAADAADADAAAADADAASADADAAADAAAVKIRDWFCHRRWYVRPWRTLYRVARFEFVRKPGEESPGQPFLEMYQLGCLPIGYRKGKDGPEFVICAPSPRRNGTGDRE